MAVEQDSLLRSRVPESILPPVPPLLRGIGRVLVVTESEPKLQAVKDLLDWYPVKRGTWFVQPESHTLTQNEAPWDNAVLVSRDKVDRGLESLWGGFGPTTLVVASDIVVWINGEPNQNLSRLPHLEPGQFEQEIHKFQTIFSREAELMWDVATSISRPGLKVTSADRHIARFAPIHPDRISEEFYRDGAGVMKRNIRIQLLELFPDHILELGTVPFTCVADRTGEFYRGQEWPRPLRTRVPDANQSVESILRQIVGGLPVNGRLEELLSIGPSTSANGEWTLR